MLTGRKVSSFACKRVFYRPEHDAKCRPHEITFWRFWNTWKKWVICLVVMFTSRVMVIKMSQFFVYSADDSKRLVTVWAKYLRTTKRYFIKVN